MTYKLTSTTRKISVRCLPQKATLLSILSKKTDWQCNLIFVIKYPEEWVLLLDWDVNEEKFSVTWVYILITFDLSFSIMLVDAVILDKKKKIMSTKLRRKLEIYYM